MPQCVNGTQVQGGAPSTFWAGGIPFLNYLSGKIAVIAAILSSLFPNDIYVTSAFCASEPVIPAAPTLADYGRIFTFGNDQVLDKILAYWKANYLASLWPTYCQCTPGGAPAGTLEAWISAQAPQFWWKYDDTAGSVNAHDYADSDPAAPSSSYSFNTPKICPNANSTCLTNSGYMRIASTGTPSAMYAQTGQRTYTGFWKMTDTVLKCLFRNYNSSNPYIQIYTDATGHVGCILRDSGATNHNIAVGSANTYDGNTHLFALAIDYEAGTADLWIDNGVHIGQSTFPGNHTTSFIDAGASFYFPGDSGSDGFNGVAQDWAIYNYAWTQATVQAAWFNAGLGGGPAFVPPPTSTPTGLPPAAPTGFTCGSYQDICTALTDIKAELDSIYLSTPIQSHQSLAQATASTGLTGQGTLPITGLLGVLVDITSYPTGQGWTNDLPKRSIPRLGVLQLEYSSHFSDTQQVHYVQQIWLFDSAKYDTLHYDFQPGVVATLTPLTAGP